jgi:hypothetical protein
MKVQWCGRCGMDVPMVDEDEFASLWAKFQSAPLPEKRQVLLDEYERLTGYKETIFTAVFHHRICMYGPPCPKCGKVLRTPIAYKCFECGHVVHEPNWAFLFNVTDVVKIWRRGTMLVTHADNIEGKVKIGGRVELWDFERRVFRGSVRAIQAVKGQVGLLFSPDIPRSEVTAGLRVQLAQSHCK